MPLGYQLEIQREAEKDQRAQRAAFSKWFQATGISATANTNQMSGATLRWLSTEGLPLSMINHLCWWVEQVYLVFLCEQTRVGLGNQGICLPALLLLTHTQNKWSLSSEHKISQHTEVLDRKGMFA